MTKIINEITPEYRAKLDQIDKDCMAMHVPTPPKTFINMKVHDKDGSLLSDYSIPSRSWVRNAYNILACQLLVLNNDTVTGGATSYEAGSLKNKDTGGIDRSTSGYTHRLRQSALVVGESEDSGYGIVVGSGDTAESFEHHKLITKIIHGTGSGQLSYTAQASPSPGYNSDNKKWTAENSRIFNNNSGDTVTVKEVGLVAKIDFGSSTTISYILLCRDLLVSAVNVPNGGQLTVTYTIEMTYPA